MRTSVLAATHSQTTSRTCAAQPGTTGQWARDHRSNEYKRNETGKHDGVLNSEAIIRGRSSVGNWNFQHCDRLVPVGQTIRQKLTFNGARC